MYTFTIFRSIPKSLTSFKDMLNPKRSKFGSKQPKMGGARFFLISNLHFPNEYYKNNFYIKNQQNWMSRDINSNVDFWPKRGKFGPKKDTKWAGLDFSGTVNLNFPKEDHMNSF